MKIEQIITLRHGVSDANKLAQEEHGYVQGPNARLLEEGRAQARWSFNYLGRRVLEGALLPVQVMRVSDFRRAQETAEIGQRVLKDMIGIEPQIVIESVLQEKREPYLLEDKSGKEIHDDPKLSAIKEAIHKQHLNPHYIPVEGVNTSGFQTWPEKFYETGPLLKRIIKEDTSTLLLSHGGTLGTIEAHFDYNFSADLSFETAENVPPGMLGIEELFNKYLFKYGNAQGIARIPVVDGWQIIDSWTRPQDLGYPGQAVYE